MDFNTQQKHALLSRMGYNGPQDESSMEAFIQSSPGIAAKMGKFSRALQRGFAVGGVVDPTEPQEPTPGQQLTESLVQDPSALATQAPVQQLEATPETMLQEGIGQVSGQVKAGVAQAPEAAQATTPTPTPTSVIEAATAANKIKAETAATQAVQGQVSQQVKAAQGKLSPEAMAKAEAFDKDFLQKVKAGTLSVSEKELAKAAGLDVDAIQAQVAQANPVEAAVAAQAVVEPNELPQAAQIKESDMAQAEAIQAQGLAPDAVAVAAKLEKFSVDNETLAKAAQGDVNALDTVQGQLSKLMQDFNDGTPTWAAGAMRAANAAMAARGLGGSSVAAAAIVQAAMESAIPIAAQDAQVFQQMNLTNLSNRQQVALTNAAAQQGLALQNLNNEQQAALQNSANAFSLQSQNLTNAQSVVIANAQIKAALQGQNLNNQQQANLATAARYAEVANLNLNNRQQTSLQNNMNALNVELANLGARQQAYITNANLAASLQGQQIANEQQTAISNAARFSEAANITFTAQQQSALHNSSLMQTIGIAELNSRQAATLQNAANAASMDMTNLNNRQQSAVQNAQNFLQMDLANMSNAQQTELFRAQSNIQAMFTDQAADNAAKQFNAASENQTNQFFSELSSRASQFNSEQTNAINQFNAGQENAGELFNSQLEAQRQQFNATNSLVIAQANAQWRQNIGTMNTAAQNESNMDMARTQNALTAKALDEIWQKERDIMNFAFVAYESDEQRAVDLMLADKRDDLVKFQAGQEKKAATGYLVAKLLGSAFGIKF